MYIQEMCESNIQLWMKAFIIVGKHQSAGKSSVHITHVNISLDSTDDR